MSTLKIILLIILLSLIFGLIIYIYFNLPINNTQNQGEEQGKEKGEEQAEEQAEEQVVTQKTIRQRLQEMCPQNPAAGDKINLGNVATYNDYLFSACNLSNTCDTFNPDPITEKLLRKTEHCGAWHLDSVGLWWDYPNKKWSTTVLRY